MQTTWRQLKAEICLRSSCFGLIVSRLELPKLTHFMEQALKAPTRDSHSASGVAYRVLEDQGTVHIGSYRSGDKNIHLQRSRDRKYSCLKAQRQKWVSFRCPGTKILICRGPGTEHIDFYRSRDRKFLFLDSPWEGNSMAQGDQGVTSFVIKSTKN